MKKVINFLPGIIGLVILIVWGLTSLFPKTTIPKGVKRFTIRQNYSILYVEEKKFSIDIYDHNPYSVLLHANNYDCYISSSDEASIIKLECIDSYIVDECMYSGSLYYRYRLVFQISETPLSITGAHLKIDALNERLLFDIGNFNIVVPQEKALSIAVFGLSGVFNYYGSYRNLVGITLTLENMSNRDATLTNIELGGWITTSLNDAVHVDGIPGHDALITDYIANYQYNKVHASYGELIIRANERVKILLPVYHADSLLTTNAYIVIEGTSGSTYFDNFAFMKDYYEIDELKNLFADGKTA